MKTRKLTPGNKQASAQHLVYGELPQLPGGVTVDRVFSKDYTKAKLKPVDLRFPRIDK